MRIKTTIILQALLIQSLLSSGQTNLIIPFEFVETKTPKSGSDEHSTLNHSKNEFAVKNINGKLEIKKAIYERKCELKLSNGTLIGINHGEWGGKLSFQPTDTTEKTVEITEGNIKFIFNFKDKIYFIEGLAHLGTSEGALYELDTKNDSFTYKKLLDFEDAPEAFAIDQDKFLIATHSNFYVVKDFKKELIFKDAFWGNLYPNSIAVFDDKNVFLGIRSGIVKLDLTTKTLKFYKNDK
jgi:hypothetical protein